VEYTDKSRYYITHGRYPVVLDFHAKKAIDVTGRSRKTAIFTRALQDGTLTSANKEQADSFTAFYADARKELLRTNPKALQFIHESRGWDFQKPFTVSAICGNFTAKKIEKLCGCSSAVLFMTDGANLHYMSYKTSISTSKTRVHINTILTIIILKVVLNSTENPLTTSCLWCIKIKSINRI
jgi:hypothetical protein